MNTRPVLISLLTAMALAPAAAAENARFDFEDGTLGGWTVTEGAFARLVSDRAERFHDGRPYARHGRHHLSTLEDATRAPDDQQTGVVESPDFILSAPQITYLVAGGSGEKTYLALCSAQDGREILTARGANDQQFRPGTWTVPAGLVGQQVFVRLVDRATGGWGHLLVDDIAFSGALVPASASLSASRRAKATATTLTASLLPAAVGAAINDLASSFPAYPGAAMLARMAALEQRRDTLAEALAKGDAAAAAQMTALQKEAATLTREALLANPLLTAQPLLFTVRRQYAPDHHNTETIFVTGECNTRSYQGGGAMKVIDPAKGWAVRTLVDAGATGVARDPDVHFDGQRVVFAMRKDIKDDYHLYTVNADGSGLTQLTRLPQAADIDPIWLPDGGIAFSSTREPKYCGCNQHIMANIHRMDADGANIHRIGGSTLFEGHNRLLPDGRILYYRWEYVDRDFGSAQGLWTVNPDGTGHALFWGNNTASPGGVVHARPIPGSERVVCILGSCHDRPWGALAILDRRLGIDATATHRDPIVMTWPRAARDQIGKGGIDGFKAVKPRYENPYPLSEKYFLCSRELGKDDWQGPGPKPEMGLWLVDVFGNEVLIHAEGPGCYSPVPLAPKPRPPVLPTRRDYEGRPATVYVSDAYEGTHMQGVKRGDIKWMRVVESPEKRHWTGPAWNGQGVQRPAMNWHNFENKRILGTVPVEDDGSVQVEIPADTFVFFQMLDAEGMMIHSMRSGVTFQSGERVSCLGCHEDRLAPPPARRDTVSKALRRAPSRLDGWHGKPRLFSFMSEVQPVLDRHCVSCHDFGKPAGQKLVLAGDKDLFFNAAYEALHQRWNRPDGWLRTVGAGPAEIQQANSWGSRVSPLITTLRKGAAVKGHENLKLGAEDMDRLITWVDLNAPYYPNYACAFPDHLVGRSPLNNQEIAQLKMLTGVDLAKQAGWSTNRGPLISFDRPELSPCIQKLGKPGDAAFDQAVAIIRTGAERLKTTPRGDVDGFTPCAKDQERERLYEERRQRELRNRAAIKAGTKAYDP